MSEPTKFYLFKRANGYYYILYVEDGRKRWKSTGAEKKGDALRALSQFPGSAEEETEINFAP
jgi:hypothetical protein